MMTEHYDALKELTKGIDERMQIPRANIMFYIIRF